jgi:hypothetical protein
MRKTLSTGRMDMESAEMILRSDRTCGSLSLSLPPPLAPPPAPLFYLSILCSDRTCGDLNPVHRE